MPTMFISAFFNALENKRLSKEVFKGRQRKTETLRPVHEKLNQKLDHTIIQAHYRSVLHTLVQSQALCAPQNVFPGVVSIRLHREGHCVELVAEEGEEAAISDHSLGHERPGDVLVIPETYRGERKA